MKNIRAVFEKLKKLIPEDKVPAELDSEIDSAIEADASDGNEGLVKKNKELLAEKKKLERQIQTGEIDSAAKDQIRNLEEKIEDLENEHKQTIKSLTSTHENTLKKLQKDLKDAQDTGSKTVAKLHGITIEQELTKALIDHKASPKDLNLLRAYLGKDAQVVVENGVEKVMVNGKVMVDHVKEYLASDEGKHHVDASGAAGGGAAGGAGGAGAGSNKAWKEMSLTEQTNLFKANPTLAKQKQQEAVSA